MKLMRIVCVFVVTATTLSAQVGFKLHTEDAVIDISSPDKVSDSSGYGEGKLPVYRTMAIIEYDRTRTQQELVKKQAKSIEDDLANNSTGPNLYSDDVFRKKKNEVDSLNKVVAKMQHQMDSLYFVYVSEYVDFKKGTFFPGPLRARAVFDQVYGNGEKRFKAMGNAGVQFGMNGTASIYSEIVSGNMGMVRVGFGTMLTSDDSENDSTSQEQQAYQRLISNGGNTILSLEYPMFYGSWFNNQSNCIVRTLVKGSADFPAFGTSTDKWAGSIMVGFDAYLDIATDNNQIRFFANANSLYVRGTDIFRTNLAVASPDFSFGQLTAGIVFMENYKLSFIVCTWSTQAVLEKKGVAIGGQVLR